MGKIKRKKWIALCGALALATVLSCLIPTDTMQAQGNAPSISVSCGGIDSIGVTKATGQQTSYRVLSRNGFSGSFTVSAPNVSQLWYFLDHSGAAAVKENAELEHLGWQLLSSNSGGQIDFPSTEQGDGKKYQDGKYLLYLKAEYSNVDDEGAKFAYYCCDGVIVDTTPPVIKGIENGIGGHRYTYPANTYFTVEDATKVKVFFNEEEVPASPIDGNNKFQIKAQEGTSSCVVTAKDEADNPTEVLLWVMEKDNRITESRVYTLNVQCPYILTKGKWKVTLFKPFLPNTAHEKKDTSIYIAPEDGTTIYVEESGSYTFYKIQ